VVRARVSSEGRRPRRQVSGEGAGVLEPTYVVGGVDEVRILVDEELDDFDVAVEHSDVQQSPARLVTSCETTATGGVGMGWAKSRRPPNAGASEFQARIKKTNLPATVKITTSGYQTIECYIATLPT